MICPFELVELEYTYTHIIFVRASLVSLTVKRVG